MTSAPASANIKVHSGPGNKVLKSSTRIPLSGCITSLRPCAEPMRPVHDEPAHRLPAPTLRTMPASAHNDDASRYALVARWGLLDNPDPGTGSCPYPPRKPSRHQGDAKQRCSKDAPNGSGYGRGSLGTLPP